MCFTWLPFCSVPSENWLLLVEGQFLHLENEGKPSLSLPRRGLSPAGIQGSHGTGLGILVESSSHFKRPQENSCPKGKPQDPAAPEFGVPRFPLVCLVDSSIFLKMQLRCCLLREVFLSFLRASASPCPSPGLSQPLVLISAQRESLSSAACLPVFFHPPPQCSGRGCLPIPGLLPPGRWQQPVTSTGDCLW